MGHVDLPFPVIILSAHGGDVPRRGFRSLHGRAALGTARLVLRCRSCLHAVMDAFRRAAAGSTKQEEATA